MGSDLNETLMGSFAVAAPAILMLLITNAISGIVFIYVFVVPPTRVA